MNVLDIEIKLDASLDEAVVERMAQRYQLAPESAKIRFDLNEKELSKYNERVARIHCFVERVFEKLSSQGVSEETPIRFIKKIEDDLDLIGSISLGLLKTKELSIEYLGGIKEEYEKKNPNSFVYFAHEYEVGQYFSMDNLSIADAKKIRSYHPEADKTKVRCHLSDQAPQNLKLKSI
ncbi:MAG: hypothetical protein GWP59_06470 [Chlamydiales bacterium]|nr:hypothetical protein [Chlamydiales bacterium]NCF71328.1 hypothetical protein [Chlamydiales bacterium]